MTSNSTLERLKFCNFKLDTLMAVTQAINANLSTDELLNSYEHLLMHELKLGKVLVLGYNQKKWEILLESGTLSNLIKEINVDIELKDFSEISTTIGLQNPALQQFDVIIPVIHNNAPLGYVLIGDIEEETEGISPTIKHLQFVQILSNIIMVAIENKRLYEESLKQEAIRIELQVASRMQAMLIPDPDTFPRLPGLAVYSFYLSHFAIGGDYYDYFKLNEYEIGFCISDVSGKGISAALLMSNFQANLTALFISGIDLKDLVILLNDRIWNNANGEKFITLFVAKYNIIKRKLTYINAGHNPPVLYNDGDRSISYLSKGCIGVGMMDEIPTIEIGEVDLNQNKSFYKLLCYTDGLVELNETQETEMNLPIVENYIKNQHGIEYNIRTMIREMRINRDNSQFFDDVSLLGFQFF